MTRLLALFALCCSSAFAQRYPAKPVTLIIPFPPGGWGIGLLGHAFSVFRPAWFLGPECERQQVEKRLGRPL